jgi:hypothetical protein
MFLVSVASNKGVLSFFENLPLEDLLGQSALIQ